MKKLQKRLENFNKNETKLILKKNISDFIKTTNQNSSFSYKIADTGFIPSTSWVHYSASGGKPEAYVANKPDFLELEIQESIFIDLREFKFTNLQILNIKPIVEINLPNSVSFYAEPNVTSDPFQIRKNFIFLPSLHYSVFFNGHLRTTRFNEEDILDEIYAIEADTYDDLPTLGEEPVYGPYRTLDTGYVYTWSGDNWIRITKFFNYTSKPIKYEFRVALYYIENNNKSSVKNYV